MTQELIERLRGKHLKCECHASCRGECCCSTDWPESFCDEAADALERLTAERDALKEGLDGWHKRYLDCDVERDNLIAQRTAETIEFGRLVDYCKAERDALAKDAALMRVFIKTISKQKPEKPDYWCSCGQCERNISEAEDIIDAIAKESKHDRP